MWIANILLLFCFIWSGWWWHDRDWGSWRWMDAGKYTVEWSTHFICIHFFFIYMIFFLELKHTIVTFFQFSRVNWNGQCNTPVFNAFAGKIPSQARRSAPALWDCKYSCFTSDNYIAFNYGYVPVVLFVHDVGIHDCVMLWYLPSQLLLNVYII